ncbi:ACP S-malonyltransferase [Parasphingorhabdus sp.]|uniref:ACP S-malonyltransferase n=1 Tax=Parasphingorhabdus sp. TaxID=2709688 RepID=UPI003265A2BB
MRAFIFPGQGSQAVGMGKDLAAASTTAKEVFQEVDHALEQNLFQLMCDGPEDQLTLTENAQPAIMANAIATLRVMEKETGRTIAELCNYVAGHSLGEYTALCAAGALNLTATAKLLKLRGESMQKAVPVGQGGMAALLGADTKKASNLAKAAAQGDICTIANDNDPTQVVISGHMTAIDRAIEIAKEHDIKRAVKLPVSAPFHCSLMKPAAEAMEEALAETTILPPVVPVFANVTASATDNVDEIRGLLVEQVTGTVRWRESVLAMSEAGVEGFVEFGGKVLGGMVKRITKEVGITSLVSMDDITDFASGD